MASFQGILKKSTAVNVLIDMYDSTDHQTGKTGLTLTIKASKAGGAYSTITPTVTERTLGSYQIAFDANHTDTNGDLVVEFSGTGADTLKYKWQIRDYVIGENDASFLSSLSTIAGYLDTEIAAIKAKTDNLPSDPADASDVAASAASIKAVCSSILAVL